MQAWIKVEIGDEEDVWKFKTDTGIAVWTIVRCKRGPTFGVETESSVLTSLQMVYELDHANEYRPGQLKKNTSTMLEG